MHSYRRVAAVVIAAGLLATAGCWNPAPEKYPSITFFGSSVGSITTGGSVQLTWQTRLADEVKITATTASGTTTVADFKSGDTTNCTVTAANSDCVMDGSIKDSPTTETVYNIEALVGAGNCDRDPILGNLLHPTECNDLTADPNASLQVIDIPVIDPATVTLSINGSQTASVASGTDVSADYTVTGAGGGFAFGVYDTSGAKPTFTECGPAGEAGDPCNYPAADSSGNIPDTGKISIPNVTAETVVTGKAQNGADDGLGDVAPGSPNSTVDITITAPSSPKITAVTIDGNDALGTPPAKATADTAQLAWTANTDATGGTLMSAKASDAATSMDCSTVPAASWAAVTGFKWATNPFTLTGLTEDMCYELTATGTGTATDVKYFMVPRMVDFKTFTANTVDVMTAANQQATGFYKFSVATLSTSTNPPVLAWTTSNAGSYSLSHADKPAGTACNDAAAYTGATPVTGATGDGTFTPAAAIGATPMCLKVVVTHPTDNARTATLYFEIDQ